MTLKYVDGKIIKVVEEDVTEQVKQSFNNAYNTISPKIARKEQLQKAIEAYQSEIDKIDTEIETVFTETNKEIIKQIEPEKAAKLGF